jgi:hypothetical protein
MANACCRASWHASTIAAPTTSVILLPPDIGECGAPVLSALEMATRSIGSPNASAAICTMIFHSGWRALR